MRLTAFCQRASSVPSSSICHRCGFLPSCLSRFASELAVRRPEFGAPWRGAYVVAERFCRHLQMSPWQRCSILSWTKHWTTGPTRTLVRFAVMERLVPPSFFEVWHAHTARSSLSSCALLWRPCGSASRSTISPRCFLFERRLMGHFL